MSRTSKGSDQTLYQILTLPGGQIHLSAYAKWPKAFRTENSGLSITDGVSALSGNSLCAIDTPSSDWQRLFTTVTLGESKTVRAGFVLEGAAIGTVYVDGAMFTKPIALFRSIFLKIPTWSKAAAGPPFRRRRETDMSKTKATAFSAPPIAFRETLTPTKAFTKR